MRSCSSIFHPTFIMQRAEKQLSLGFWPVSFDDLKPFQSLSSKAAKVGQFHMNRIRFLVEVDQDR
jgi:hypothetical protein